MMWRLENSIQHYAWGSHTAIARLQGRPTPTDVPEAELWIGAHPKAPSRLIGEQGRDLLEAIEREPTKLLGDHAPTVEGPRLPFLLKVLAAAEPLSIQAHPNDEQARRGFDREQRAGLALDAPNRNYRDPYAKPELVCALDRLTALCGFRPLEQTRALIESLEAPVLRETLDPLWTRAAVEGIAEVMHRLLTMPEPRGLVEVVREAANQRRTEAWAMELAWIERLAGRYPADAGVVVALLLHCVELKPYQALFLSAGQLHCYLEGTAIELMGGSDNVLRGGLTGKYVDGPELLSILDYRPRPLLPIGARPIGDGEWVYDRSNPVFSLSRVELAPGQSWKSTPRGPELLVCVAGEPTIERSPGKTLGLEPGAAAFIAATSGGYRVLASSARAVSLFRATGPLGGEPAR